VSALTFHEVRLPLRVESVPAIHRDESEELLRWRDDPDRRKSLRASIVILRATGRSAESISLELSVAVPTVYKWCRRYRRHGIAGLKDLPRSGQPRRLSVDRREEIARITLEEQPPRGARWTIRVAARHLGVTEHQIRKVWHERGVRPHERIHAIQA
jgi:transposase